MVSQRNLGGLERIPDAYVHSGSAPIDLNPARVRDGDSTIPPSPGATARRRRAPRQSAGDMIGGSLPKGERTWDISRNATAPCKRR